MAVCPCLEWWVSNGLILSEWCSFLSCWFWVCWIWQTAYLQCCHVVDSAISFFCIAQVRKSWLLWWMAGSTADTCWVYFVVVSCLDTNTSLVPLFLEQRVWQPVLSTHNRVVPHIQTHFHIGKGTLRMLWLSWVMHFVCVDMIHKIYAVNKFFNSEAWVVLILLWCCRCKHSWLHFEHCHVGKSNTGPMQPVRRFVADQVSFPDLCSPRRCF